MTAEADRGRAAEGPRHIPRRGWRDVLLRVKAQVARDHVSILAAGVAFYAMLALFPALSAVVALYGLVASPSDIQRQVEGLSGIPEEVRGLLVDQLERLTAQPQESLGLALVGSLLLALWSAGKGAKAVMEALNVAYDEQDRRGFVKRNLVGLALTASGVLVVVLAFAVIGGVPALMGRLALGAVGRWAAAIATWALLLAGFLGFLAFVYRFAPHRADAKWRWISPGAVLAAVGFVGASLLFTWYVGSFGDFQKTYGALGAVVILLLWLWIVAYMVLLGGELNCEAERQTGRDSTTGPPAPMGERGAYAADTLGERP